MKVQNVYRLNILPEEYKFLLVLCMGWLKVLPPLFPRKLPRPLLSLRGGPRLKFPTPFMRLSWYPLTKQLLRPPSHPGESSRENKKQIWVSNWQEAVLISDIWGRGAKSQAHKISRAWECDVMLQWLVGNHHIVSICTLLATNKLITFKNWGHHDAFS